VASLIRELRAGRAEILGVNARQNATGEHFLSNGLDVSVLHPNDAGQVASHFEEETLMKRSIFAVLTAAAMSWAGIWPAVSAENSLVGTWQVTSFSMIVLDTKETSRPYGDHPTGG
jgi:hypothetical protein